MNSATDSSMRARTSLSEVGLAVTTVGGDDRGSGRILALTPRSDALTDAATSAIALGAVGVLNVAGGAYQLLLGRGAERPA